MWVLPFHVVSVFYTYLRRKFWQICVWVGVFCLFVMSDDGRVDALWRMVKAGGVTKARTGPNWRRWDRVSPVDRACPKPGGAPHPPNCSSFTSLLPISSHHPLSLYLALSLFFFSFRDTLLTKRFTNPGWYIIHDRLLWDWFRQMDSGREGRRREGCVPPCSSFRKPPHGPHWIFLFLLRF